MPGGQPSTTTPIAGPWDSPQVVIRNNLPKELEFILNEKEEYDIVENNLEKIKNYITGKTKWKLKKGNNFQIQNFII